MNTVAFKQACAPLLQFLIKDIELVLPGLGNRASHHRRVSEPRIEYSGKPIIGNCICVSGRYDIEQRLKVEGQGPQLKLRMPEPSSYPEERRVPALQSELVE